MPLLKITELQPGKFYTVVEHGDAASEFWIGATVMGIGNRNWSRLGRAMTVAGVTDDWLGTGWGSSDGPDSGARFEPIEDTLNVLLPNQPNEDTPT